MATEAMDRAERYTCPECGGSGEVFRPCPWCGGAGRLYGGGDCPDCGGGGGVQVACEVCAGTGWLERVSGIEGDGEEARGDG